jgi:cell division control protein 45
MCVVKDSPDSAIFNHPGALTKLALWIGEALTQEEKQKTGRLAFGGRGTPLVVASLNEQRGVYTVVGTGGGGGPDTAFVGREAARKKAEAREAKAKIREQQKLAKERAKAERRAEREREKKEKGTGEGDEEGDDEDTESEGSDSESDSDSDGDQDDGPRERGYGLNKFGMAFQQVVAETNARVRIDSFEHCVVEVKKEDLSGFMESLCEKPVIG